ncbi:TraR/DksA C4-type zinc finger protein [Anaeroselena agilis]|uniref:TraR/DksA C4-type zinc finger protein n=1 Tax=Anaeroselena agilis TaxID=3063788 RepID=A0ABU3NW26_9FIRM|nr:TraR/DksA C4-type zinc finger protein [Selenomonadales bacterium 4137-cl]
MENSMEKTREKLLAEKDKLTHMISRLEETGIGDTMSDSVGELSMYDNHPADLGDVMFERSKDVALRDNEHILLERVETALDKMAAGTYGTCEKCGRAIGRERLDAVPWASLCICCQQETDGNGDPTPRPLEEEILAPPFHRTFLDTVQSDFVGFDGEDALQAVLRWGSSDTPQDIPGTYNYKALWPNSNEHEGIVDLADSIPDDTGHTRSPRNEKEAAEMEEGRDR